MCRTGAGGRWGNLSEEQTKMELTGAEIAIRCLEEEGVKHIFGYPGGAVLYIYDALYSNRNIQHIANADRKSVV